MRERRKLLVVGYSFGSVEDFDLVSCAVDLATAFGFGAMLIAATVGAHSQLEIALMMEPFLCGISDGEHAC